MMFRALAAPLVAVASFATTCDSAPKYLFSDEFNGPQGAPDSRWVVKSGPEDFTWAQPDLANVFVDGQGRLDLRIKRDSSRASGFSGGWVDTFHYGSGWPPQPVLESFSTPFRVEVRMLQPATAGAWTALWAMNTDRTSSQGLNELDIAEERMTFPTSAGAYQHRWVNGSDVQSFGTGWSVSNMADDWHVFAADVRDSGVTHSVDGVEKSGPGVSGSFGLILDATLGAPGSWGSGGQEPSGPGPWDLLVDYVRVSAL